MKIKTVPHSAKIINIIDMMETRTIVRTISEQLFKAFKRTTSLGQNLLVIVKKKASIWSILGVISYCCCSYEYFYK